MRSSRPIPGDPWPHDMVLTIDDTPGPLLELLWLRERWDLRPQMSDAPPPLVDAPDRTEARRPDQAQLEAWQRAWPEIWRAAADHAGTPRPDVDLARLPELTDSQRADVLRRLVGPTWGDLFGEEGLEDFWTWSDSRRRANAERLDRRGTIERDVVDALVPAWRAGLLIVVTVPVTGEVWQRIGSNGMLIAEATRADRESYAAALRGFAD